MTCVVRGSLPTPLPSWQAGRLPPGAASAHAACAAPTAPLTRQILPECYARDGVPGGVPADPCRSTGLPGPRRPCGCSADRQRDGPHPVTPCNEAVLPLWMSGSPSQLTIGWGVRVAQRESGLTAEPNPPRRAPGVLAMPRASLRRALAVLSV